MNGFCMSYMLLALAALLVPATASAVKLTIYDDGRSCPSGCDAHVVFHPSMNGTPHAHHPQSYFPEYEKCNPDTVCEICFGPSPDTCISAMYRGSGPGTDTFDFTPAFYEEHCAKEDIPRKLLSKCSELARMASGLEGRINCIRHPDHRLCASLMSTALQLKDADIPLYMECLRVGQSNFNRTRHTSEKRIFKCAYEYEKQGGPNSRGMRWHKLLPGACRDGTYAGEDGLDCCSGSPFADGALGMECRLYYPGP